jgi:hypothetical protein
MDKFFYSTAFSNDSEPKPDSTPEPEDGETFTKGDEGSGTK